MPTSVVRYCLFCALLSALLAGCSKSPESPSRYENITIPLPSELDQADPLISQMLSRTASAIKNNSYNPENWAVHASALLANAYFEESIKSSEFLLRTWPDFSPKLQYRQAIARWRLNQQTQALAELSQLMEENPDYESGWRLFAKWQLEIGDVEKATVAIQKAISLNPDLIGADVIYAQILLQEGNATQVIEMIEPKLNHEDTPPYLYFLAGQAYRQLGNFEAMESSNEKGMPVPDQWPDPWLSEIALFATGEKKVTEHGLALLDMKEYKKALPFLKQSLQANSENSNVRAGLAYVFIVTGQLNDAQKILDEIPNPEDALYSYWLVYAEFATIMSNNIDQLWLDRALECYAKSIELNGSSPAIFKDMSSIAELSQEYGLAQDYILEGATLLIDKNEIQEAKIYLSEAIVNSKRNDRLTLKLKELVESQ